MSYKIYNIRAKRNLSYNNGNGQTLNLLSGDKGTIQIINPNYVPSGVLMPSGHMSMVQFKFGNQTYNYPVSTNANTLDITWIFTPSAGGYVTDFELLPNVKNISNIKTNKFSNADGDAPVVPVKKAKYVTQGDFVTFISVLAAGRAVSDGISKKSDTPTIVFSAIIWAAISGIGAYILSNIISEEFEVKEDKK